MTTDSGTGRTDEAALPCPMCSQRISVNRDDFAAAGVRLRTHLRKAHDLSDDAAGGKAVAAVADVMIAGVATPENAEKP